jgi:hypothetical protein
VTRADADMYTEGSCLNDPTPAGARRHGRWTVLLCAVLFLSAAARGETPPDYFTGPVDDAVARLQKRIDSGEVRLEPNNRNGYLESVLKLLGVPPSSQSLVFSKTSMQRNRINPANPRAIFFEDDTYVGFVPGADLLELAATDPNLGTIFYSLTQPSSAAAADAKPKFVRQTHRCLACHGSTTPTDVPGLLVRSVYPDAAGLPVLSLGTYLTTQESPWSERFGGWYVTGKHGAARHMGNVLVANESEPHGAIDREAGANVTDLSKKIDVSKYPSPGSDLVALMVLEHQAETHNVLARANADARAALRDEATMNQALGRPTGYRSETTTGRIKSAGEALVRQFLFADEPELVDPIEGTSGFAADFESKGPRDSMGRSLRQLDLKRRVFRFPLSYLIYSESFDALPGDMKDYVYRRLWDVLNGAEESGDFAHLKRSSRRAIVEILAQTKKGLPEYWDPAALK